MPLYVTPFFFCLANACVQFSITLLLGSLPWHPCPPPPSPPPSPLPPPPPRLWIMHIWAKAFIIQDCNCHFICLLPLPSSFPKCLIARRAQENDLSWWGGEPRIFKLNGLLETTLDELSWAYMSCAHSTSVHLNWPVRALLLKMNPGIGEFYGRNRPLPLPGEIMCCHGLYLIVSIFSQALDVEFNYYRWLEWRFRARAPEPGCLGWNLDFTMY